MESPKRLFKLTLSVGLFFLFTLSQINFADIIILKNGRRITGDIIGESPTMITVKTVVGTTTVIRSLISEILKEEQEVNHVRNGDYYMDKGDYAAATTEYSAALRLNPNLVEVQQKLNEAKGKAAQSTIDQLSPAFADGDRLLSKGFYDDAVRAFRDAVKSHPEPEYLTESNRKIDEVCRALIAKGDEYASMKSYNSALESYAKVTIYNSGELAAQSNDKIKGLALSLFSEGDSYLGSQDLVKASRQYEQVAASYPGSNIDAIVKDKLKQLTVLLRYKPKSGDQWKYKMNSKTAIKLPTGEQNMPQQNVPINMDFDFTANLLNNVDKVEGDEIDLIASIDSVKASMNFAGTKQKMPIPSLQQKSFSYRVSNTGKSVRNADLSSITGEGMMGSETMFAGIGPGYLSTLPSDTVHVGDKWVEPLNQQINLGAMGTMKMTGRIRYTLLGFENMAKYPCAKIEGKFENVHMTFNGKFKPAPDKPAQTMDMDATMNGTGTIYFAYNEGKMIRNSNSSTMEIAINMFSGGDTPAPIQAPNEPQTFNRPPMFRGGKNSAEGGPPPEFRGIGGPERQGPVAGPTPIQQTGKVKITGTVLSDLVLVD